MSDKNDPVLLTVNSGNYRLRLIRSEVNALVEISQIVGKEGDIAGMAIILEPAHYPLLAIAVAELTRDGDPLPKHEHATCATKYLLAERTVRIIEGLARGGKSIDSETLETIDTLVDIAGVQMAREALSEPVPF